mmetsp:Transcript_34396/g.57754  ORF Transcript_34396/g.57754 Transcript_34396/m.57754 type:complete len:252 (-) Transcript_34396:704-1459(-)
MRLFGFEVRGFGLENLLEHLLEQLEVPECRDVAHLQMAVRPEVPALRLVQLLPDAQVVAPAELPLVPVLPDAAHRIDRPGAELRVSLHQRRERTSARSRRTVANARDILAPRYGAHIAREHLDHGVALFAWGGALGGSPTPDFAVGNPGEARPDERGTPGEKILVEEVAGGDLVVGGPVALGHRIDLVKDEVGIRAEHPLVAEAVLERLVGAESGVPDHQIDARSFQGTAGRALERERVRLVVQVVVPRRD